jgi:hypothetical protein
VGYTEETKGKTISLQITVVIKVKISLYRPGNALRFPEYSSSQIS